jgi:hypothetical protein
MELLELPPEILSRIFACLASCCDKKRSVVDVLKSVASWRGCCSTTHDIADLPHAWRGGVLELFSDLATSYLLETCASVKDSFYRKAMTQIAIAGDITRIHPAFDVFFHTKSGSNRWIVCVDEELRDAAAESVSTGRPAVVQCRAFDNFVVYPPSSTLETLTVTTREREKEKWDLLVDGSGNVRDATNSAAISVMTKEMYVDFASKKYALRVVAADGIVRGAVLPYFSVRRGLTFVTVPFLDEEEITRLVTDAGARPHLARIGIARATFGPVSGVNPESGISATMAFLSTDRKTPVVSAYYYKLASGWNLSWSNAQPSVRVVLHPDGSCAWRKRGERKVAEDLVTRDRLVSQTIFIAARLSGLAQPCDEHDRLVGRLVESGEVFMMSDMAKALLDAQELDRALRDKRFQLEIMRDSMQLTYPAVLHELDSWLFGDGCVMDAAERKPLADFYNDLVRYGVYMATHTLIPACGGA